MKKLSQFRNLAEALLQTSVSSGLLNGKFGSLSLKRTLELHGFSPLPLKLCGQCLQFSILPIDPIHFSRHIGELPIALLH
ncbi:hypothetical protein EGT47_15230 [Burkholderia cenocepacia]|nr:hypothetical protein EGT47_15230 [Burkholderia cenocepacia]